MYHILSFGYHHSLFRSGVFHPLNKVVDFYDLLEQVLSPNYCESTAELVDINFRNLKHEEHSVYEVALCSMDHFVASLHEYVVSTAGEGNYVFSGFVGADVILRIDSADHKNTPMPICTAQLLNQRRV